LAHTPIRGTGKALLNDIPISSLSEFFPKRDVILYAERCRFFTLDIGRWR